MIAHTAFFSVLPADLRTAIGDATCVPVTIGQSDTTIFRVVADANETCYLKIASPGAASLIPEMRRLAWLADRLPVPRVLSFAQSDGSEYLLLSAMPGRMACDDAFVDDMPRVVRLLARGMRMIHAVAVRDCPFDMRLDVQIATARQRVADERVDTSDFDAVRQGRTAESLFAELLTTRPDTEDLVVTHGDYCLPNVLIEPDREHVGGFVDLGRVGVADRYQDVALAARSLGWNLGERWIPLLYQEYGLDAVDDAKIAYYQLLDEFF